MKNVRSDSFKTDYKDLPTAIQKKCDKQLLFLRDNLRHPSLRSKKYDEANDIWQARVDDNYRFYFVIKEDSYILLRIKKHPK